MEKLNIFLEINHEISNFLWNFIIENHYEKITWFMADFPIFFLPIFFIWFWFFYEFSKKFLNKKEENKSKLLFIFYWIFIAIIVNLIIQNIIFFERPEITIPLILEHVPDASFPSDHAAVSFAFLSWLFFFWYRKIFWYFLPFVILMNISRISWWLHWFFDVFAWAIIWWTANYYVFKKQKNIYLEKLNSELIKIAKIFKL